jgi:hypothetical protein
MRVGDALEERLAGRTTPVGSPVARAETTARAGGLRGEQVMADRQDPAPFGGESAQVRPCWMCGIRSPVGRMVADGGSACADVRWYCRDTWGCTQRWTSHPARLTVAEAEASGEQLAGRVASTPATVMTVLGPGTGKPPLCGLSQLWRADPRATVLMRRSR